MREWRAVAECEIKEVQSPSVSTRFSPGVEKVSADTDQAGRTWLRETIKSGENGKRSRARQGSRRSV